MMTALKLCGNSLLANARVSAAASPLATRPRVRSLIVSAAKATGPPSISQSDFVDKLAKETEIPQTEAKARLKAVLDLITDEVSAGNKITFTGFGTFLPRERAARKGRNPQTQEPMDLPASKSPGFTASKTFKDRMNSNGKS